MRPQEVVHRPSEHATWAHDCETRRMGCQEVGTLDPKTTLSASAKGTSARANPRSSGGRTRSRCLKNVSVHILVALASITAPDRTQAWVERSNTGAPTHNEVTNRLCTAFMEAAPRYHTYEFVQQAFTDDPRAGLSAM